MEEQKRGDEADRHAPRPRVDPRNGKPPRPANDDDGKGEPKSVPVDDLTSENDE